MLIIVHPESDYCLALLLYVQGLNFGCEATSIFLSLPLPLPHSLSLSSLSGPLAPDEGEM